MEVDNAKGSARLLHLSLPRSQMVIGEVFPEQDLQALLYGPLHRRDSRDKPPTQVDRQTVLLYPEPSEQKPIVTPGLASVEKTASREPSQLRLVVLDGTWRKSRKMLYLNPLLQKLPRLPLRNPPPSQYLIRKAHSADQLSTLEATCYALMQLEESTERYRPLLEAFNGFVAQQSGYRPTINY